LNERWQKEIRDIGLRDEIDACVCEDEKREREREERKGSHSMCALDKKSWSFFFSGFSNMHGVPLS
jgi:hypothetical protein